MVVIDENSKPTNCIKYNRPSKYATKKGSNTPILQRWWWCVVKPIKFSILSPINHSTGWMVVIKQMKKIIKKYQMIKRRRVLCTRSLNIRIPKNVQKLPRGSLERLDVGSQDWQRCGRRLMFQPTLKPQLSSGNNLLYTSFL